MAKVETERLIKAPPDRVFQMIADIEQFEKINPKIKKIEFLSETHTGVGTRFKETRDMRGRDATTTLEITEYEPPSLVRLVSDEGGTIWDTVFTVTPVGDASLLKMQMGVKPYKLSAKVFTPLIMRMVKNAIEVDMDGIRTRCETV